MYPISPRDNAANDKYSKYLQLQHTTTGTCTDLVAEPFTARRTNCRLASAGNPGAIVPRSEFNARVTQCIESYTNIVAQSFPSKRPGIVRDAWSSYVFYSPNLT